MEEVELTPEQKKESNDKWNREIALKACWLHEIFQEYNMTLEDKQKVLKRLRKKFKQQDMKAA